MTTIFEIARKRKMSDLFNNLMIAINIYLGNFFLSGELKKETEMSQ